MDRQARDLAAASGDSGRLGRCLWPSWRGQIGCGARAGRTLYSFRKHAGAAMLAAAYGYGFLKGRPFVDGNRRVAFLAVTLFLAINGFRLTADPLESLRFMLESPRDLGTKALAKWIEAHMERAS